MNGKLTWQLLLRVQLQDVAPLGEASTFRICLRGTLLEIVKTTSSHLRVAQWASESSPHTLLVISFVQLDSCKHAIFSDQINHVVACSIFLEKSLPMQNDATDGLRQSRCCE